MIYTTEQAKNITSIAEVNQRHQKRQATIKRRRAEESQQEPIGYDTEAELDRLMREYESA